MAQAYAQFRGVMTVELGQNSQAAFSQFQNQATRAGDAGVNSMNRFTRSVDGLEGRLRAAGAGLGAFQGYGGRLASQFNAAANAIALTGARVGGLIAALAGGTTVISATADIQNYTARLKAATDSQGEFVVAYESLRRVAGATRSDLGETINFYTRLKLATSQLGLSQNQLAGIITTVQQSIRLSGAGAQEANAALIQFVQGISSANGLSGDEFKSLGENATQVLRNIARGLKELGTFSDFDGTISSLRKLGKEGKLTADVLIPALQRVSAQVEADFAKLPPTIDQASTALRNGFLNLIVQGEQATGILSGLASAMIGLANNLDTIGIAAAGVGGILLGRLAAGLLATRAALVAVAAVSIAGPIGALTSGFAAAMASGAAFRASLTTLVSFLGGPWAVGLGAAAAALVFLVTRKNDAAKAASDMGIAESQLGERVQSLTGYILDQNAALDKNVGLLTARRRRELDQKIDDARTDEGRARNRLFGALQTNVAAFPTEARGEVSNLSKRIADNLAPAEVQSALSELEKRYPKAFKTIGTEIDSAADAFAAATARVKANEIELGQAVEGALNAAFPIRSRSTGERGSRTAREVLAAAEALAADAGTVQAARARFDQSLAGLNKEFKIKGNADIGKLSPDAQDDYQQRLAQIRQTRDAEIKAIKDAEKARRETETARRASVREQKKEQQELVKLVEDLDLAIAKGFVDGKKANDERLAKLAELRAQDATRLAILDLQIAGESASAEVLQRIIANKETIGTLDRAAIEAVSRQVEAEAQRNVLLERRQKIVDIQTRALGQIQGAFTNLFAGDIKNFLPSLVQTFRRQFAERLSLQVFGDVEREAQLENIGALNANTTALEGLVRQIELLGVRFTGRPAVESVVGPNFGEPAANDNGPAGLANNVATLSQGIGSLVRLTRDGQIGGSLRVGSGPLGAFGATAGGRFAGNIGMALEGIFGGGSRDASGARIAGGFARKLGGIGAGIGAGFEGFAVGSGVLSIIGDLGIGAVNSRQGKTGSAIGAIAGGGIAAAVGGGAVASALGLTAIGAKLGIAGGPIGIAVGALIGTIVGGLFGAALKKNPFGDAALSATATGASGSVFNSRFGGSEQAQSLAGAVSDGLGKLADGLGLNLRTGTGLGSIGFSGEQFYFNSSGGDFKAAGNQRFSNAEDAVTAAIKNAVQAGAFEGLRDSTRRLLLAGADLNAQAQKAAEFENVFTELRRALDPTGAAVEELNRKFARLQGLFIEAGASVEEYGKLQQLYDLQRKQALEQQTNELKDFLAELTTSSNSGLSAPARQAAAQANFAAFQNDINAGRPIDQGKFRDSAQALLEVNRELYGSQAGYFDTLGLVTDLTRRAIATVEQEQNIPEALRLAIQPLTDATLALVGVNREILGLQGGYYDASLGINREILALQNGYLEDFRFVTDLTGRTVAAIEQVQNFPEALRAANQPVTDAALAVQQAVDRGFVNLNSRFDAGLNIANMPANDWAGGGGGGGRVNDYSGGTNEF